MTTAFGDKIKDLPIDKDDTKSPDLELVNSIFVPNEQGLLTKEIKLAIIGIVLLYGLFREQAQTYIYGITKNDNMTKGITVGIVIIVLFLLNRSGYM
jgi:VanZ family protein